MYNIPKLNKTNWNINDSTEGETIEQYIERITNTNEGIEATAPVIWTERKDGVIPSYDIRTDRFDVAIEHQDAASRNHAAKRQSAIKEREEALKEVNKSGDPGPTQDAT